MICIICKNQKAAILTNIKQKKYWKCSYCEAIFLDKEFIYETRDDVYIYRDNRTKKKGYYIRIYDPKTQKY